MSVRVYAGPGTGKSTAAQACDWIEEEDFLSTHTRASSEGALVVLTNDSRCAGDFRFIMMTEGPFLCRNGELSPGYVLDHLDALEEYVRSCQNS